MKTVEIPIGSLREAIWNPNRMDDATAGRLRESLRRYGMVQPLVVRPVAGSCYEVISGNQRLRIIRESGATNVPCVVVDLDDTAAMLLAEALNSIHGEDDLAIKGALLKKVLATVPPEKVLSLLPETAGSLQALSTIGQEDLAAHLAAWQKARSARLKHMQVQFSAEQLETVEKAIDLVMAEAGNTGGTNPNTRGTAIYLLAKFYLERKGRR